MRWGNTMDRSRGEIAVAGNIYKRTPTEKTVFVFFLSVARQLAWCDWANNYVESVAARDVICFKL